MDKPHRDIDGHRQKGDELHRGWWALIMVHGDDTLEGAGYGFCEKAVFGAQGSEQFFGASTQPGVAQPGFRARSQRRFLLAEQLAFRPRGDLSEQTAIVGCRLPSASKSSAK